MFFLLFFSLKKCIFIVDNRGRLSLKYLLKMKNKHEQTTPAVVETATPEIIEATVENANGNGALTISTPSQRNVTSVFEKLQQGQKLHDSYQKAKNRLTDIEDFKSEFDGSGLEMVITNRQGTELTFTMQESIVKYIDAQIEHGKEIVGYLEAKVIEFSI